MFDFNLIPELWNQYWHWIATFYLFALVKALNNALRHDYKAFKQRFGIKDEWDFWFDPRISHRNKYDTNLPTPISDLWHTLWTLWMTWFQFALYIETGNVIFSFGISGVIGVWLIFNGIYAFARRKKYRL